MNTLDKFDIYRLKGCSEILLDTIHALDSVEHPATAKLSLARTFINQAIEVIKAEENLSQEQENYG